MEIKHKKTAWIIDSTLRDGEQAPGIIFSLQEKVRIASMLDEAGISEIEVGIPGMGSSEMDVIKKILENRFSCRMTSWCRALTSDITAAAECGTESVHIAMPVSDIQLDVSGKKKEWLFENSLKMTELARKNFDHVSIGFQDSTRCDRNVLIGLIQHVSESQADRIRLADTVGVASPVDVIELISAVRPLFRGKIEFHAHNDLGMASANAFTALQAGADAVSVTVNGIGERAGNAALEEVAAALSLSTMETTLKYEKLKDLCEYVAAVSGKIIPENKPVTGKSVFSHESGIHCDGQIKNPCSYQPFRAEKFGRNDEKFIIGTHSGSSAVSHVLNKNGKFIHRNDARIITAHAKELSARLKRPLNYDELSALYSEHCRSRILALVQAVEK